MQRFYLFINYIYENHLTDLIEISLKPYFIGVLEGFTNKSNEVFKRKFTLDIFPPVISTIMVDAKI